MAQNKLCRLSSLPGTVKYLTVNQLAFVVHHNSIVYRGFGTRSFFNNLVLQARCSLLNSLFTSIYSKELLGLLRLQRRAAAIGC
jgi:hypothetical protein